MKYTIEPNLTYDKKVLDDFVKRNREKSLKALSNTWHITIDPENLIEHFYPLSQYLHQSAVCIFTQTARKQIGIHADGSHDIPERCYSASLNIPISGCTEKTKTIFWKFEDNRKIDYQIVEKRNYMWVKDWEEMVPDYTFSLIDKPVIIKSSSAHSVQSDYDEERVLISWRFDPKYSWDDVNNICKKLNLI